MSLISAGTNLLTSITFIGDQTGNLVFQSNNTTALTLSNNTSIYTGTATFANTISAPNTFGFKNRIINGAMQIDQRFSGSANTPTTSGTYTIDRWKSINSQASKITYQRNANSITPPAGYSNYFGLTVASNVNPASTDYFGFEQPIETYNLSDISYGSSSASTLTASFWVRSSVVGTYGVGLWYGTTTSACIQTFTISIANAWQYVTVSFPGASSPSLVVGSTDSMSLRFDLGSGTNFNTTAGSWVNQNALRTSSCVNWISNSGATFYVTGVQLEVGPQATPFDVRDYGRELIMCQRYYYRISNNYAGTNNAYAQFAIGRAYSSTQGTHNIFLPVSMRAVPTLGYTTPVSGNFDYGATALSQAAFVSGNNNYSMNIVGTFTSGGAYAFAAGNVSTYVYVDFSAEF
jgi:hypothetical protein